VQHTMQAPIFVHEAHCPRDMRNRLCIEIILLVWIIAIIWIWKVFQFLQVIGKRTFCLFFVGISKSVKSYPGSKRAAI
jgi:hypothetical protein